MAEAKAFDLAFQVRILTAWNFQLVNFRASRFQARFKLAVNLTGCLPVIGNQLKIILAHARITGRVGQSCNHRV